MVRIRNKSWQRHQIRINLVIAGIAFFLITPGIFENTESQTISDNVSSHHLNWKKLSGFFQPSEAYIENYGDYRSPLKFYDGKPVENADDWKIRKEEILAQWNGMMGTWPPFIENQKPVVLNSTMKEGYLQQQIRFEWLPGHKTDGYLLIPHGANNEPAVITVFYEPETAIGESDRNYLDFALQLTKRGFVTLSLGTDRARAISGAHSLYYPDIDNSQIEPLSVMAYAASNAWFLLAGLSEVDPERIGILGHSYGGKWALFASCLFEKFACAAWSDPGIVFDDSRPNINYWEPWYLGYYPPPWEGTWRKTGDTEDARGIYPELRRKGFDLHELHSLMAPRPFLVSGGSEDPPERWIPLNHTIAVNRLLGFKNRVAMTNRPEHGQNAESNEQIFMFFEYFLKYNGIKKKVN